MSERLQYPQEDAVRYWIGPDIAVAQDRVIYSHDLVSVTITPESLPPLFRKQPEALQSFRASARSRYAQIGLDPYEALTQQIAHALVRSGSQDLFGRVIKPFEADVLVYNHGQRPIHLMEGSRIFRLYNSIQRPLAHGQDVVDLIKSGEVQIKGERGKDWDYSYWLRRDARGNLREDRDIDAIAGVNVRIDDENRKWIPPHPQNTPIRLDENDVNNRNAFNSLSEEVPEQEERVLWIGETAPEIVLAPHVDALLDKAALVDVSGKIFSDRMGIQTESHLIEGGRTNWKVRVEIVSPTDRKRMPNAVTFYLAPKPIAA